MGVRKLFFYVGTVLADDGRPAPPVSEGYMRNLFTFMTIAGYRASLLADEVPWELCLNTMDHTLEAGLRVFKYYKPKFCWGKAGNRIEYDPNYIKDYVGSPITLDGEDEKTIRTAAIRRSSSVFKEKNWPDRVTVGPANNINTDNCSGKCAKSHLDELRQWIQLAVKNDPVFSVCDCNSFHNSGYLFGSLALKRRPTLDPVLIVNFDTHNDDQCTEGMVNSDGWGEALLKEFPKGAYVVIGCGGPKREGVKDNQTHIRVKTAGGHSKKVPATFRQGIIGPAISTPAQMSFDDLASYKKFKPEWRQPKEEVAENRAALKQKFSDLWEYLEKYIYVGRHIDEARPQAPKFKHYFVTIDRDCMLHSHTQWGHEKAVFRDPEHVRAVLDVVAESLRDRGTLLAGLDITGLPEEHHVSVLDSKVYKDEKVDPPLHGVVGNLYYEIFDLYRKFKKEWILPVR